MLKKRHAAANSSAFVTFVRFVVKNLPRLAADVYKRLAASAHAWRSAALGLKSEIRNLKSKI
ncbi:MAG: hypothetical protein WCG26_14895 [Chloroflexales bacterium]